jgi:hypothetical protein
MSDTRFFVARDGQEIGPFTRNELLRAIADGRYGKGDFLWQDSVGEWLPLETVQPFARQIGHAEVIDVVEPAPAPPEPPPRKTPDPDDVRILRGSPTSPAADLPVVTARQQPAQEGQLLRPGDRADLSQRRPFVRYAARLLDMAVFSFLALGTAGLLGLHLGPDQAILLEIFLLALYVPVEAVIMGKFGTTPGKALLRIRVVREDGRPLDLATAMNRAVMVWWRGWGIGVPIVSLVALIVAFSKLMSQGQSTWDRDLRTRVLHGPVGLGRGFAVLVLILFLFGVSMGSVTQRALQLS